MRIAVFTLLLLLLLPLSPIAQTSAKLDSLRDSRAQMLRELKTLNSARDAAKTQKEASLLEMELITKQILLRQALLKTMAAEVRQLDTDIADTKKAILDLEAEMKAIQEEFGRLMVVTYKSMHQKSKSFYLLSAKSVSQSYKRLMYFKAISELQDTKLKRLKETKAELDQKKYELEQRKVEKQALLQEEKLEAAKLNALKEEQRKMYDRLKAEETRFAQQIKQTESAISALNKAIDDEIKRLIKLSEKPKTAKEDEVIKALNKDFASNKGRLPWPLPKSSGSISRKFGLQKIAGSNTDIDLQGIDITTRKEQSIRAIFKGKVAQVMPVPGQGKIVIVQHGEYYSVYANLQDVLVISGQEVNMLQTIGTARTEGETGETKIHFQLYKGRTPQNPELWLAR